VIVYIDIDHLLNGGPQYYTWLAYWWSI